MELRQAVIRMPKSKNSCRIGKFNMKDILKADTVFLTGTAIEIQLVGKILKRRYNLNNDIYKLIKKITIL